MKRLVTLVMVFATLAMAGVTVVPGLDSSANLHLEEAHALGNPQSTLLRSLSPAELKALIADIDAQGLNTSGTTNTKIGVGRMQLAAGRFGALSAASKISVAATGSLLVWKIADAAGLGGFTYRMITGSAYTTTSLTGTVQWWYSSSLSGSGYDLNSGGSPGPSWYFRNTTDNEWLYCGTGGSGFAAPWYTTAARNLSGTAHLTTVPNASIGCGTANTYIKVRTNAQMADSIAITPSDAAEFASPPVGATTIAAGTADPSLPTDPELEAALDAIDPNPGTTGSAIEEDTAEAILDELDPGWDNEFITLLQPQPNETYTDYILRLQAEGWLGSATSTVLASENGAYGPESVVRITYTQAGTSTTRTLAPLTWPTTAPQIELNDDIAIRYNPDTAAPAPTEGTGAETTVTLPPTTIPPPTGIDFTPITDLDGACSFPFGFICYAHDVTDIFSVTPDAPRFEFEIEFPEFSGAGGGSVEYNVDLAIMDDYMAILRTLISFAMWVGAVYWLAVNLLGFRAGGDPGEAADEGVHA